MFWSYQALIVWQSQRCEIIGKKPGVCRNFYQNELKDIYDDKTIDPDLKTLLNNLLQLNPYLRWSPRECLRLPTFDEFRSTKNMENVKCQKIKLAID